MNLFTVLVSLNVIAMRIGFVGNDGVVEEIDLDQFPNVELILIDPDQNQDCYMPEIELVEETVPVINIPEKLTCIDRYQSQEKILFQKKF